MSLLKLCVAVLDFLREALLVMLQHLALFLELHLQSHDLLFFHGQLPRHLLDFVLKLILQLANLLLSPLKLEGLLLKTLFDSCDLPQRLREGLVALGFFHPPVGGDLLDLIYLLLLQMNQEL